MFDSLYENNTDNVKMPKEMIVVVSGNSYMWQGGVACRQVLQFIQFFAFLFIS